MSSSMESATKAGLFLFWHHDFKIAAALTYTQRSKHKVLRDFLRGRTITAQATSHNPHHPAARIRHGLNQILSLGPQDVLSSVNIT